MLHEEIYAKKWWKKGCDDPHLSLFDTIKKLEDANETRRSRNAANLSRYENRPYHGLRPGELTQLIQSFGDLTLNVSRSCVQTVSSKICMHRPRPMFLTEDGSYEDQQRAKLLQRFVMGVISQNEVFRDVSPDAFEDGAVFDAGIAKIFFQDGRIKIERVIPDEILVDEEAARNANPRDMFQIKYITKEALMARYPKSKIHIMAADVVEDMSGTSFTDMAEVVEGWHLPSKDGAGDGRHIIAIKNATLELGEWTRNTFPFAFIRWERKRIGFWGLGLVEQLAPIQDEIEKVIQRIQEGMHMLAVPWVILDKGSGINKRHIKNKSAIILEKSGGPDPKVQLNAGVHPQMFEYLERLYQKAYQLSGVSELSAHSQKPDGLRSGAAMRTLLDAETQRFGNLARAWEQFHVDIARLIVIEAKEAHERGEKLEVNYCDREWIQKIKFSRCNMEEDRYRLEVYPTSMLPQTPAGKLALVQELAGLGAIQDPAAILELLQLPDVEKFASLETANIRSAHQIAEYLLSGDNRWIPPEEFMDLQTCVRVAQKHWVKGHLDNVPRARLDTLAEWIKEATALIQESMEPPPDAMMLPGQPGMGQQPPMDPMAPPAMGPAPEMPLNEQGIAA